MKTENILLATGAALLGIIVAKNKAAIGAVYKKVPTAFYPCLDGTFSDHNRNRACSRHGGMITDEPAYYSTKAKAPEYFETRLMKALPPATVPVRVHYPGKEIAPDKTVKANKAISIKEIAPLYDLTEMEAGILLQLANLPNIDIYDYISNYYGKYPVGDGLKGAIVLKLDKKGFLADDYSTDTFSLTDKAKQFIKAVNARIETRKAVKAGTDLFPEYANISGLLNYTI